MPRRKRADGIQLERISTGVQALDKVLEGGIPRGSVVFIGGLPGAGKTILAEQMTWWNARRGETVLYIGTLSEPTVKMLHFSQTLNYFDAALVDRSVVFADISDALKSGDPDQLLAEVDRLITTHRPGLVVIDSFKAIQDTFSDAFAFRVFTTTLTLRFSVWEATALLVGEYTDEEIRQRSEFAIADGIIYLYGTEEGLRQDRRLRIMKMRGTSFFAGDHGFEIDRDGITLYPRMSPAVAGEYVTPSRQLSSVIPGISEMIDGGLSDSTSCLITGTTGSGKTLLALSFAVCEAQLGNQVLYVSLEESANQLARNCSAFGWDVAGLIESGKFAIMHISPSELNIDRHAVLLKDRALEIGATVVVIDSISSFEAAALDIARFQSYLWAINDHFKRAGITTIMTSESAPEAGSPTARHISLFADAILNMGSVETDNALMRTIRVVKVRGSKHTTGVRELIVEAPRLLVSDVPPATGG
ncbi:MAG: ATPase domain-containing protein [Dehalococcoidia bacterium]